MMGFKKILFLFLSLFFLSCENPQGDESYVGRDFDPGKGNGIDISPPSEPTLTSVTGSANASQARILNWLASSDNNSVSHYEIALGATGIGSGINDLVNWRDIGNLTSYQLQDGVDGVSLNLSSNTFYFISLRAVDEAGNQSTVATTAFSFFLPGDYSNLVLWLDLQTIASLKTDGGCSTDVTANLDAINCMIDLSGNNHTFTTTSGTGLYTTGTINSYPALILENGERMETPDTALINIGDRNEKTHYIVFQTDADVTTRQILYKEGGGTNGTAFYIEGGLLYIGIWIDNSGNASDRSWISYPVSANTNYIAGFTFNDNTDTFTASLNGSAGSQAALGGQSLKSHTGDIAIGAADNSIRTVDGSNITITNTVSAHGEHIMYDQALSAAQQETVEGFMACKWSLQSVLPTSHPYKSTCP